MKAFSLSYEMVRELGLFQFHHPKSTSKPQKIQCHHQQKILPKLDIDLCDPFPIRQMSPL